MLDSIQRCGFPEMWRSISETCWFGVCFAQMLVRNGEVSSGGLNISCVSRIQGSYDRENSIRFIPEVVSCGFTIYFNVGVTKRNRKWAKRWVVSVIYLIEVPWQPKITFQKPTFKNSHIHRRFFPPVGFHKSPTQRRRGQKRKRPGWQDVDRRRYDGQWMQPTTIRYLWIRNILPVTVAFMKV